MAKHLIVIHGRSIKPAEAKMSELVRTALVHGLERAGDQDTAARIQNDDIKLTCAYYGDINNAIQARENKSDRVAMTAKDPDHDNAAALPHELLEEAMALTLLKSPKFTRNAYRKVLDEADDMRLLDEATSVISFFGAVATFGFLNEKVIEIAKPDMSAYLMNHDVGSAVRERLQACLVPGIAAGDDIMLVSHSMGCMVAYDVFWKISHQSEYSDTRAADNPVRKWLTIGCPLAEPGVRSNLRDGHLRLDDKYPRNAFLDWVNIWAEDDFIAHRSRMKSHFRDMTKKKFVGSIADKKIYNCWVYSESDSGDLISNPHDLYGYLITKNVGAEISAWAQ